MIRREKQITLVAQEINNYVFRTMAKSRSAA